jgi:demethylmenaquinone methyltransferase/2-methoxy-6-polyprenyl-1,4-benzoquinol methylase
MLARKDPHAVNIEASMVHYYARRAAEYDRVYLKPERQHDLQTLQRIIERTFFEKGVNP